jgi:hypothetical protein
MKSRVMVNPIYSFFKQEQDDLPKKFVLQVIRLSYLVVGGIASLSLGVFWVFLKQYLEIP